MVMKDKKIDKLSSTISQFKNEKKDMKKSAEYKYKDLENVIFAKDLKIISFNNQIIFFNFNTKRDRTIEPSIFITFHNISFWASKCEEAKDNPNIKKKYTF